MSIALPDLDDLDYDDLVAQALASIPTLYPGWTNENASDPGITLVELFAWLVDMVIYRTNRIPPESYQVFLRLLGGPSTKPVPDREIPDAIRRTLAGLHAIYRAVTPGDYDSLALTTFPETDAAKALGEPIRRVACLGERDVTGGAPLEDVPGHMSLVVASGNDPESPWGTPSDDLRQALGDFFEDRRLITTTLHVAGPGWIVVGIGATLYLANDASPDDVLDSANRALRDYLHPWTGGPEGAGWPFGRWIYASEMSVVLGAVEGVDAVGATYGVDAVTLSAQGPTGDDRGRKDSGSPVSASAVVAIEIQPQELPQVGADDITLTLMVMRGAQGQKNAGWAVWSAEGGS